MNLFSSILAGRVVQLACWLAILATTFRRRRNCKSFPNCIALRKKYHKLILRLEHVAPERRVSGTKENCVICLDSLDTNRLTVRTLPCGHTFHSYCLESWLIHVFSMSFKPQSLLDISWALPLLSCPMCKQNIPIT
eukprot:jgi/Galph1/5105/GphlegSOOS_G3795.1